MTSGPSTRDSDETRQVHLTDDELSAYLNGDFDESETATRIEAHLDTCDECRERFAGTRSVVSLLNNLETPVRPRSFKIDPSMLGPKPVQIDPWIVRVQPAMRRLTAIAAALLIMVVVADALTHRGSGGSSQPSQQAFTTAEKQTTGSASLAVPSVATAAAAVQGSGSVEAATAAATSVARSAVAVAPASTAATATPGETLKPSANQPQSQSLEAPTQVATSGPSYWRLAELAVGVVVVWLLFLTVALPRLQSRRDA